MLTVSIFILVLGFLTKVYERPLYERLEKGFRINLLSIPFLISLLYVIYRLVEYFNL